MAQLRRHGKPTLGKQMSPEQYLEGWRERKTWEHNYNDRHKVRFNFLARNCVGETFADVGCAFGHSTELLAQMHPGNWTGIEFNEQAVHEARGLFPLIVFKFCEHPEKLNAFGQFDTVVCSEVIEHVEDPPLLLRALMAMTGKRLLMTTPCKIVGDPGHVRVYNDATLVELLRGLNAHFEREGVFYKIAVEK
jgi:trans-aconitate methyltransferase